MTEMISKTDAEKILGLTSPYTFRDLESAYREKVKETHPDAGGDSAQMMLVNKSKQVLSRLFSKDKAAVIELGEDASFDRVSRPFSSGNDIEERASDGFVFPRGWSAQDRQYYEDWVSNIEHGANEHASSQVSDKASEGSFSKAVDDFAYVADFASRAYGAYRQNKGNKKTSKAKISTRKASRPVDDVGNAPAWYGPVSFLGYVFPWKIAFALMVISIAAAVHSPLFLAVFSTSVLLVVWNFITGIFTDPLASYCRYLADSNLLERMRNRNV